MLTRPRILSLFLYLHGFSLPRTFQLTVKTGQSIETPKRL